MRKCLSGNLARNAAADAAAFSGPKLSSITTLAPAFTAFTASSSLRHSTSIFTEKPLTCWAASTALRIDPAAAMWLSLIITMLLRSMRWGSTPPTTMAYFSTRRKSGVVLRDPATTPLNLCSSQHLRKARQRVAIPLARANTLSATRSAWRRRLAAPSTVPTTTGESARTPTCSLPSSSSHETLQFTCSKRASTNGTPASTPSFLRYR
mmetsp:Transcript_40952/g.103165  ORF Transcript_40952/g.103165 Transcript_40952/m.103165 type:complete len:208 (-) Transcript_40952:180-803(-)